MKWAFWSKYKISPNSPYKKYYFWSTLTMNLIHASLCTNTHMCTQTFPHKSFCFYTRSKHCFFIQVAGIATDPFGNILIGDSKNFRILLFPRQKIDGEEDLDEAFTCISLEFYRNGKKFRQYRPSGINLVNGLLLIADLKGKAFLVAKVKK